MSEKPVDVVDVLMELGGGKFLPRLHMALILVAEKVLQTNNSGNVTVKFTVSPADGDASYVIAADVVSKDPKALPFAAQFYTIGDGQVYTSDPRQTQFTVVPGEYNEAPEFSVLETPARKS